MRFESKVLSVIALLAVPTTVIQGADQDRFNYYGTEIRTDGFIDYGPAEWGLLDCLGGDNIQNCLGYPESWDELPKGWEIKENSCQWCPEEGGNTCRRHHQSPIDLKRNRGIIGHEEENECIDLHWMKYEDSTCSFDQLVEKNAFGIERHALQLRQPIEERIADDNTTYVDLACPKYGVGRRWGRIDFSKGFSQWWYLSHIDFHIPSEHTQEGKRYSAEAQMYHFYSVSGEEAGVDNELASVAVFFEAMDDVPPWDYLDKLICQWRQTELKTRTECGLDSSHINEYPGCFPMNPPNNVRRRTQTTTEDDNSTSNKRFKTAFDVFDHNRRKPLKSDDSSSSTSSSSDDEWILDDGDEKVRLVLDDDNWRPEDEDFDWDSFIENHSSYANEQEERYLKALMEDKEELYDELAQQHANKHRELVGFDYLSWFNYFLMLGVRTEYYFRYEGTQTIPPCYGPQTSGSRGNTTHWRVLKDPIRVHPRQIAEMERLLRDRIAPKGSFYRACQRDTAGKVNNDGTVDFARPVQSYHRSHVKTYCECKDWKSRWPEDRHWCDIRNVTDRFYNHPYGFHKNGF